VAHWIRDLALFNLALDSKLRACDLVALRVDDVALNGRVRSRATVIQRKTGRPVQFEITEQTREAVGRWLEKKDLHKGETLFPSRINRRRPMTTRQYARLLASWLCAIGLDPSAYGTYSLQRTKASMIYRRTGNLRAVQLLLGHTKIESTVQYLGIDDALLIAEQVEI
jgi:integrase